MEASPISGQTFPFYLSALLSLDFLFDIPQLIGCFNSMSGSKVMAMLSRESVIGWFYKVVELHQEGSATNGALWFSLECEDNVNNVEIPA